MEFLNKYVHHVFFVICLAWKEKMKPVSETDTKPSFWFRTWARRVLDFLYSEGTGKGEAYETHCESGLPG